MAEHHPITRQLLGPHLERIEEIAALTGLGISQVVQMIVGHFIEEVRDAHLKTSSSANGDRSAEAVESASTADADVTNHNQDSGRPHAGRGVPHRNRGGDRRLDGSLKCKGS